MTDFSHPSCLPLEELETECEFRTTKRSGPGGQHRNKVETAVIVTHRPSGCVAEANESRSQATNRLRAMFRLRLRLAVSNLPEGEVIQVAPSALWESRRAGTC